MRKRVFGRKLKRDTNQRKSLFRNLASSFVLYGKIKTTEAKAKAVKGQIEKMVTKAKKHNEEARRFLLKDFSNELVVDKIIGEIAPKFQDRPGGYTRILKLGSRVKDNAQMVMMTWVEEIPATVFKEPKRKAGKASEKGKKATKKESKQKESAKKNSKK